MASSSAANIFSGSMSFSRDTCRMTDGSMIIGKRLSSIRLGLARPLKTQPRHPDIAETDIIDSAVFFINDPEPIALDALEDPGEVSRRGEGRAARLADRQGHDR